MYIYIIYIYIYVYIYGIHPESSKYMYIPIRYTYIYIFTYIQRCYSWLTASPTFDLSSPRVWCQVEVHSALHGMTAWLPHIPPHTPHSVENNSPPFLSKRKVTNLILASYGSHFFEWIIRVTRYNKIQYPPPGKITISLLPFTVRRHQLVESMIWNQTSQTGWVPCDS